MEKDRLYIALGGNIRRLRKARGMTQAQLAEKISRSEDAVSNIERGGSAPPPETAFAISNALNVELSDLYDFDVGSQRMPTDVRNFTFQISEQLASFDTAKRKKYSQYF